MKKPGKTGGKARPQSLDIKRHYTILSPEETQEVVELVADFIVDFVKKKGLDSSRIPTPAPGGVEKFDPEKPRAGRARKGKGRR